MSRPLVVIDTETALSFSLVVTNAEGFESEADTVSITVQPETDVDPEDTGMDEEEDLNFSDLLFL